MEIRFGKEKRKIFLMAILLAGACVVLYYHHEALDVGTVFTHLFYIPIILAGFWWKRKGLVVAVFLGVALISSHYFVGHGVLTGNDFLRGFMFVGIGFVAALLTEKLEKEEGALRRAKKKLTMLLESLPVVPYTSTVDADWKITFVGPTAEELGGYNPQVFIGDPAFWCDRIHPDDRNKVLSELRKALHDEHERHQIEYRFQIADGSYIWVKDIRRFKKNTDGRSHVVGTLQDITTEKKLRRESEYRLQQIIQADKLVSLGEMVAGVAHEINNPNSFITYNIPLLEETWELFEPILTRYAGEHPEWRNNNMSMDELCRDMNEIIQAIKTGSDRINKVVTNLKDFVRVHETTDPTPIHINEMIEKTLTIVGAQVRKSIATVALNLASNLPQIHGNAQKLEQVIANLVGNALGAVTDREKGRLSITTRYIERLKSVLIEIEDNGIGMKPGVVNRLFEPFFTTRRESGGTGLGLSVSYGLIKEHNGVISVLSHPGLGSRFTVFLPIEKGVKLDLKPSILCVDDEMEILSILKEYFMNIKKMGFETVGNPETVVGYLEEHPEVDIVLSDIAMPNINGWELLKRIKARFPLLKVILCSGYPDKLKQKPNDAPEPDHLLLKPFKPEQLTNIINAISRQRL